jgi:glutathione peroxidase
MSTVHDFSARTIDGKTRKLADYKGKVLLIVNTASKCGFTPQYKGLEELHKQFGKRGLAVLGFPSNQFGQQEPGPESEIAEFCEINYGVTFPLFAKIDVNGEHAHPLYKYLTKAKPGLIGGDQVELHQVPDRPQRRGGQALCADDRAEGDRGRYREAAWLGGTNASRLRGCPTPGDVHDPAQCIGGMEGNPQGGWRDDEPGQRRVHRSVHLRLAVRVGAGDQSRGTHRGGARRLLFDVPVGAVEQGRLQPDEHPHYRERPPR